MSALNMKQYNYLCTLMELHQVLEIKFRNMLFRKINILLLTQKLYMYIAHKSRSLI